jgi:hypothetical protein
MDIETTEYAVSTVVKGPHAPKTNRPFVVRHRV